ncbi:type II toxin-antitoxin system RelE/ParE family toxin [Streptomyces sp. HU2014]|uniref:type II toxin-antitoxin system RelE family toxin n=1 Tax=Streptomyces sp. HU2014 TaxID=2939414 RepID=UPI00200C32A9|nr:type II toxin-antitoxin system RelE/ParE family toxin [Streptomyces sp. HU2014]UQI45985.1 type II toxin-antitoxin system RelE/ParE family toxin [Streptomyces sp. HU2014]
MSYSVELEPAALNAAARFLKDDPVGLKNVLDALDALADNPRPVDSSTLGTYRRLRIGPYRALYAVEDETIRVIVLHLGRITP